MIYDTKLPHHLTLDKCPFCQCDAELFADGDGIYVGCAGNKCLIKPITLTYATKRDAIRAWNLRAPNSDSDPIIHVGGKLKVVKGE
ncbi:Lar family restriction alleviation protein [Photorhabdus laumondii]|uniref:Lar family restriction alleviation protein n=1 Tax=Photorhabdus laumondii TaxID=2218628 RepID=UPI0025B26936|nr:Lar family restriction alleviation protein [Photorhabdus laumondii]